MKWQRGSDDLAPEGLKDVHPLGLAPVIVDGDATIAESGAIVRKKPSARARSNFDGPPHTEYLLRKYGKTRETLPESARMDDLYCARSRPC